MVSFAVSVNLVKTSRLSTLHLLFNSQHSLKYTANVLVICKLDVFYECLSIFHNLTGYDSMKPYPLFIARYPKRSLLGLCFIWWYGNV